MAALTKADLTNTRKSALLFATIDKATGELSVSDEVTALAQDDVALRAYVDSVIKTIPNHNNPRLVRYLSTLPCDRSYLKRKDLLPPSPRSSSTSFCEAPHFFVNSALGPLSLLHSLSWLTFLSSFVASSCRSFGFAEPCLWSSNPFYWSFSGSYRIFTTNTWEANW